MIWNIKDGKDKTMPKPLIFITNDDGIDAKGLHELIDLMRPYGDLFVSVPHTGKSGMSQSLTLFEPLKITKVKDESGLVIYKCNGTPVDSVKLAFDQFIPRKPDYFVSGINHGSNSSISAFYSGTVGTVIEAYFHNIPSAAFSLLSHEPDADFGIARKHIPQIFEMMMAFSQKEELCLNVNFPDIPQEKSKGIKICRQTKGYWKEDFLKETEDSNQQSVFYMRGNFSNEEPEATDTDEWALTHNFVSIVPLSKDLTNYSVINKLENKI